MVTKRVTSSDACCSSVCTGALGGSITTPVGVAALGDPELDVPAQPVLAGQVAVFMQRFHHACLGTVEVIIVHVDDVERLRIFRGLARDLSDEPVIQVQCAEPAFAILAGPARAGSGQCDLALWAGFPNYLLPGKEKPRIIIRIVPGQIGLIADLPHLDPRITPDQIAKIILE